MAPAAGPGWEEPTSQLYPRFRTELDYVFTHEALVGSAYDGDAMLAHPRLVSQSVGTECVPCGMLELAARPSHYAHFCALSRYGVTTERSDLSNLRWTYFGGIRDVRLAPGFRFIGLIRNQRDHVKTNPRLGRVLAWLGHIDHMDSLGRSFLAQTAHSYLNPSACHPRVPDRTYLSNRRKEKPGDACASLRVQEFDCLVS